MRILINLSLIATFVCFAARLNAQNALHFDGNGDYVQTTFPGILGVSNRTFEAWIKVDIGASASNLCIMDYGLNAVGSRNTFSVTGTRGLTYISGGTNANISSAAGVITEGVWTHVAFVLDNGTGFIYANGVQVATGSLSTVNTPSGNTDLRIGERVSGGSIQFEGLIDEVRVWNSARSQQEIQADSSHEFCSYPSNLACYFTFNQGIAGGNNSTITTLSEHIASNSGTLNSFALNGNTSNWVAGKSLLSTVITSSTEVACDSFRSPSGLYNWTTSGNYSDTLTTGYGCDSIVTVALTINTVDPIVNVNGLNITSAETGANYQWLDCDSNYAPIAGEISQTLTVTSNGNYAVRIEKNGCVDTSMCAAVTWVGLREKHPATTTIYPNPSSGELYIEGFTSGRLSLIDAKGVIAFESNISSNMSESISIPGYLQNGMYIVLLQGEQVVVQKILLLYRD